MILICGNCTHYWCTDEKEMEGFCQRDLRHRFYEDHPEECNDYEDRYKRNMTGYSKGEIMTINDAINTIKETCKTCKACIECPMNFNCNEHPAEWKELKGGEDNG